MTKRRKDAIYIDTPLPRTHSRAKRSRVIPVRGQPIEAYQYERLLKCWFCGDINTTGRDEEDNGNSSMSSKYTMPRRVSLGTGKPGSSQYISVPRSVLGYRVAPKAGANGSARAVKEYWTVTSHRGCKACGTINWTGKF
jgi:hypothetical protein